MNEKCERAFRTRDRTSGTWTRVIAGERGEEISQAVDLTARQNFGEAQGKTLVMLTGIGCKRPHTPHMLDVAEIVFEDRYSYSAREALLPSR